MKDYQKILFPYAYNILGSTEDAQDAIQEVIFRYANSNQTEIDNAKGYLIRSVINQSINVKKRKKRMIPDHPQSLPEPLSTERADTDLHLRDIASYSMLILMDKLNVKERAVFILKEAFDYSHQEIAEVLSSTVGNSRKILSRAKDKIKYTKDRNRIHIEEKAKNQIGQYLDAIRSRDIENLERLLADDILIVADGGNQVQVIRNITRGIKASIDLMISVFQKFHRTQVVSYTKMNHQPALLYYEDERLDCCQIFTINDQDKITGIYNVVDPEKLKHIHVA